MAKQSKWLKWKIGGGLIVSLAVVFQVAKADPAFGKAVQAAQENDDSFDSDEVAQGDHPQPQLEEETAEDQEYKDQMSQGSVETIPSPVVTPTQKEAQTHAEASSQAATKTTNVTNSKPPKSGEKHIVSSKAKPTSSSVQKPSASVESPAVQQPPADIPVAPPVESTAVAPVDSDNQISVQTEESKTTQEEVKPSNKKKSHSKSRQS